MVAFLGCLIGQRDDLVARNLAANALVAQERRVPGLADRFAAMALDPTENQVWRDFAVQQLADAVAATLKPDEFALGALRRIASARGTVAGTGPLQLERLRAERGLGIDAAFIDARITAALAAPSDDRALAITALGLAAQRGDRWLLPRIRACASLDDPALRRTAIAALGTLGEVADRDAIAAAAVDADPTVARAARSAIVRFDSRPH